MYICKPVYSVNNKELVILLPDLFGPTQLSQQSSEVFFSYQFPEHLLIMVHPFYPVLGELPNGKPVFRM